VLNAPDYNGVPPLVSAVSLVSVCPGGQRNDARDGESSSGSMEWTLDEDEGEPTSDPATVWTRKSEKERCKNSFDLFSF
jgi:hypothetical protein